MKKYLVLILFAPLACLAQISWQTNVTAIVSTNGFGSTNYTTNITATLPLTLTTELVNFQRLRSAWEARNISRTNASPPVSAQTFRDYVESIAEAALAGYAEKSERYLAEEVRRRYLQADAAQRARIYRQTQ